MTVHHIHPEKVRKKLYDIININKIALYMDKMYRAMDIHIYMAKWRL